MLYFVSIFCEKIVCSESYPTEFHMALKWNEEWSGPKYWFKRRIAICFYKQKCFQIQVHLEEHKANLRVEKKSLDWISSIKPLGGDILVSL